MSQNWTIAYDGKKNLHFFCQFSTQVICSAHLAQLFLTTLPLLVLYSLCFQPLDSNHFSTPINFSFISSFKLGKGQIFRIHLYAFESRRRGTKFLSKSHFYLDYLLSCSVCSGVQLSKLLCWLENVWDLG
jgi:hypothetical protein